MCQTKSYRQSDFNIKNQYYLWINEEKPNVFHVGWYLTLKLSSFIFWHVNIFVFVLRLYGNNKIPISHFIINHRVNINLSE